MDILANAIQRRKLQIKARRRDSQGSADHTPHPPSVIKGHDQEEGSDLTRSGQDHSDQEEDYVAILSDAVERQKLRIRARRASGGVDHPAPPPPVQNPPSAPPAAPAHREWTKRQPTGPPTATGFSGASTSTSTKPAAFKKKPSSIVCRVCGVQCMTASHLKQHEKGRKHRNRVAYAAGEMNLRCDVCDVSLLSMVNVQEHYASKQHLHRVYGSGSGAK